MKDDQLLRQRRFVCPPPPVRAPLPSMRALLALPPATRVALATPIALVRQLTWDEIK